MRSFGTTSRTSTFQPRFEVAPGLLPSIRKRIPGDTMVGDGGSSGSTWISVHQSSQVERSESTAHTASAEAGMTFSSRTS